MTDKPTAASEAERLVASWRSPTPFTYPGGEPGVLLIHGFTGVPGELRPLGRYLADRGYAVRAPLLAGHGGNQELLASSLWHDWAASARQELRALRADSRRIVLVGFSMGGALALHLAAHERVDAIVTMATPLYLRNPLLPLLPLARHVMPYFYPLRGVNLSSPMVQERLHTYMPDLAIDTMDGAQMAHLRRSVKVSLQAVYQLTRLLRLVRAELPQVTAPVLMTQAVHDEQIPDDCLDVLYREIASQDKTKVRFERSGHMLPIGPEKEAVFELIEGFVARFGEA